MLWVLLHLTARYGTPKKIRMDDGPEFIAQLAKHWNQANEIDFKKIQPGKPSKNAYIESLTKPIGKKCSKHIYSTTWSK